MSVIETMIDIPAEHERNVCGQFDAYLKKIERTLHVTMIARDGEIKLIGPEKTIGQAKSVFNNLIQLSMPGAVNLYFHWFPDGSILHSIRWKEKSYCVLSKDWHERQLYG